MFYFSTLFAKTIYRISNLFNLGAGFTWPGHIVLKFYPGIWKELATRLPSNIIFISGTNGKTTTAKLITFALEKSGFKVLHNKTGANLLNGILSTILINTDVKGRINADYAVLEVDEFTLPNLAQKIKPEILMLLNLSRDQLDRHWELELVLERWQKVISELSADSTLIIGDDQTQIKALSVDYKGKLLFFTADRTDLEGSSLIGAFNAKNINAALLALGASGIDRMPAVSYLKGFEFAYGRGEGTRYKDKNLRIFLAKNPESLNQNLKLLNEGTLAYDTLLFVLNDKVPDGHDVSWIYDVNPDLLKDACKDKNIFVSGTRAFDMAVRLMYAGVPVEEEKVSISVPTMLSAITDTCSENVIVLPNYSAMLETRKVIFGRSIL